MPRPKTRSDDDVLDAVARVLLRTGPHAFTLADVAREAGLSPATLVQRFATKRGLVLAFARRAATSAAGSFAIETASSGRATDAIVRGLVRMTGRIRSRREMGNSLAMLLEDLADADLRAAAKGHAVTVERAIEACLREAVRRGEIRGDPRALARLVQAAHGGAMIQWALRGEGKLEDQLRETLHALFDLARPSPLRAPRSVARPRARPARRPSAATKR